MPDTLGSVRAEILGYLRGDFDSGDDVPTVNSSINDAIEKIWMGMMQVQLARFFGADSPVTFSLPANTERVQLISIANPAVGPVLGTAAGGAIPGPRTISCAFTYVTESGTETLASPATIQIVATNNLLTAQLPSQANVLNAIGWNLYAAVAPDVNLALQNKNPVPVNVQFQEPLTGIIDYAAAQQTVPLINQTADNVSWITHMEIRTSDTLLRSWNQVDIDSMLMRQFGRTLSSASEYQAYAWDLINGRQLEIRPMTGAAFNPRYFYVAKPRRLRYDQAQIPYGEIAGMHEYVVTRAIARLKLSLEEYLAAEAWDGQALAQSLDIRMALNQEGWAKNTRVAPHLY